MPSIIITLDKALERIEITPYRLAVESKIRSNTIYEIVSNQKKMINIETMTVILETLNRLSKENGYSIKFGISDIFKYIED